jgi:hypothetical protein
VKNLKQIENELVLGKQLFEKELLHFKQFTKSLTLENKVLEQNESKLKSEIASLVIMSEEYFKFRETQHNNGDRLNE